MSTDKMREALVMARAGLIWYHENYPQTFSECDNEALEQIDAALSQSEPAQNDHFETQPDGTVHAIEPEQMSGWNTSKGTEDMIPLLFQGASDGIQHALVVNISGEKMLAIAQSDGVVYVRKSDVSNLFGFGEPAQVSHPVALQVVKGELCYKSQADDQSFGMWCPADWDEAYPEGTKFFTSPPDYEALVKSYELLNSLHSIKCAENESLKAENVRLQSECDRLRIVEFDGALNDAGWTFLEALPSYDNNTFNFVKTALKAAIEKWISVKVDAKSTEKLGVSQ